MTGYQIERLLRDSLCDFAIVFQQVSATLQKPTLLL